MSAAVSCLESRSAMSRIGEKPAVLFVPSRPLGEMAAGFGSRFGKVMDAIGSRRAIAALLGVSTSTLQRYVSEDSAPPFDLCARLCASASVRMEWLAFAEGAQYETSAEWAVNPRLPSGRENHQSAHMTAEPGAMLHTGMLAASIRIADEVLKKYGLRDQLSSEQFADIARLVYNDVSRGAAEDVAIASLDRILSINRKLKP